MALTVLRDRNTTILMGVAQPEPAAGCPDTPPVIADPVAPESSPV
jgi:hypothetical protein